MKTPLHLLLSVAMLAAAGCSTSVRVTNQNQPGPKVGNAVGGAVGAVGGNIAGGVVGAVEGGAAAAGNVFDPKTTRVVRYWKTETTPDGRSIQVPVDYEVDEFGRVVREIKKPGKAF